jgi:hypothetical protein
MAVDWASHYNGIYSALGVAALLTLSTTDAVHSLTVIDKTAGIAIDDNGRAGTAVQTIRPACGVRVAELTDQGIDLADLDGSRVEFNGKTFKVVTHRMFPAPTGEYGGEVYLILNEVDAND